MVAFLFAGWLDICSLIDKFEEAAALGAAGVLIIHNTKGAAYGWDVLRNSWGKESFFLPDKKPALRHCQNKRRSARLANST